MRMNKSDFIEELSKGGYLKKVSTRLNSNFMQR